jgi:thioredoxin 1
MATVKLTSQKFKDKIFDYTKEREWKYKGTKPAFIDFYVDWCGPCKMVAPILEELSNEQPEVIIYKVDTEVEQELAAVFHIRSTPSMLFIPMDKQPAM